MAIIVKPLNPFTIANELGYYEYAPHPVTGQTVRKVDLGRLCTHANINKWSKYKPVRFPKDGELTEAEWKSTNYGLGSGTTGDVYSGKPIGGSISPFRISDFVGYNHDAKPPVSVEIISVNGATSAPFRIYKDEDASIEFKLIPGDIDPKDLSNETVREKILIRVGGLGVYHG